MTNLGDFFPETVRDEYVLREIDTRSVVRLFTPYITTPKEKRFIVIGASADHFGCLLINTLLNERVHFVGSKTRELQIPIDYTPDCTYLNDDSYVDCSRIHSWLKAEVRSVVTAAIDRSLGTVMEGHWSLIINAVRSARTISQKIKKLYGLIS
jgi:hypothetical protein